MGQYQTFILYISAGNYYYEVIFGKDPFLRMLYLKMAPNPIISQTYFFVTSHFDTLLTCRGYFMAMQRYEISLRVLKKNSYLFPVLTCEVFFNTKRESS